MSSHKFSCRYTLGETLKMLHKDFDMNESDEEDKPKDLTTCRSDLSSDEDLCDPDDAGSLSDNDTDDESSSSRQ